jgi:hypothetical protein
MGHGRAFHFLAAAILIGGSAPADAAVCETDIAAFQRSFERAQSADPRYVGTAPQTIAAQLEHQPTVASVRAARKDAKHAVADALREAKILNAEGRTAACEAALEKARLLLDP